jgi:hypothetical protein
MNILIEFDSLYPVEPGSTKDSTSLRLRTLERDIHIVLANYTEHQAKNQDFGYSHAIACFELFFPKTDLIDSNNN